MESMKKKTRQIKFPLYTMAQPSFLPVTVDHIFRNQLVDYLVGTSFDMHLNTTTVFLAVAYFDTFLIHQPMSPTLMECALFTCLLIATKMEEVTPPSFQDLRPFLQRHYTSQELLHMEATILSKLQFRLNRVTLDTFLADWLVPFSTTLQHQAWYLAYAILADSIYVDTPPSLMAAAILYCCAPHPDGYHGYTVVDFKEIIWHIEKTVALKRRCHIDRWLLKRHDIMAVTPPTP
ncbi:hypothetical protein HMI55_007070 [Coelomomyces lativittatus]|nr:hypothetical protein HMI55_007070 [Coelomomyces lativittatus]